MALSSALVDQARIIRKAASGVKVEGRTTFVDTQPGTWFAARLIMPPTEPDSAAPGSPFAFRRVVLVPTLIYDLYDFENNPVDVRNTDYLEVESDALGNAVWQVVSAAHAFRKKRDIIAYQVTLRAVDVEEFAA